MSRMNAVLAARELLKDLTPLKTDCGRLCQGACFARVVPTGFSLGGTPAQLLVCDGRCDRKNRPLACRLFPLFLKFREDQTPVLRMDARARAVCPLTDYGMKALDPEFKQAARRAYDLLLEDKVCAAYLRALDEAFTL